ncbi:dethiobiotin synthase [Burkholderiaceae bacterium DAT-1]|nr:dethiobiotin synthase [Burkholderiaceae bacterium DAT-1]
MSVPAGQGYFITGTDTEVGKTFVTCELLRGAVATGQRAVGMKPVASGCLQLADGSLQNEDVVAHERVSNVRAPLHLRNPYAFEPPVSPHIAAAMAGVDVSLDVIGDACRQLTHLADLVLVEGAGGWLAPLTPHHTMADLAQHLALPVILVVGMRLGCLNHAMLTAEAILARNLTLAGWVANCVDPAMLSLQSNLDYLSSNLPGQYFGAVPHGGCAENLLLIN